MFFLNPPRKDTKGGGENKVSGYPILFEALILSVSTILLACELVSPTIEIEPNCSPFFTAHTVITAAKDKPIIFFILSPKIFESKLLLK